MQRTEKTLITAHAGAENTEANTMKSILTLAEYGVDYIEVDVQPMNGTLVLSHNDPIPGTAYATLEECFRAIARHKTMKLNVDLKREGMIRAAAELAAKCGMENRYVLTGSIGDTEIPFILENHIAAFYNAENLPAGTELLSGIREKGFYFINMDYTAIDSALLDQCAHRISAWTVGEEDAMIRFLEAGVKNITTRSPLLALELRKKIQG